MDTSQSKITIKDKKAVINKFLLATNATGSYGLHMKNLNELLETYSLQDISYCLDYLISYPPPKGFYSLKYIGYVAQEILAKRDAKAKLKQVEQLMEREVDNNTDSNNIKRYQNNKKGVKFKGTVKF